MRYGFTGSRQTAQSESVDERDSAEMIPSRSILVLISIGVFIFRKTRHEPLSSHFFPILQGKRQSQGREWPPLTCFASRQRP